MTIQCDQSEATIATGHCETDVFDEQAHLYQYCKTYCRHGLVSLYQVRYDYQVVVLLSVVQLELNPREPSQFQLMGPSER